ncbi:MAG TPA: sialidase family protein [Vicinamibacteria bacterium]|nr:sialidase family protein [Vicinamibacteria bacterium]
MAVIDVSSASVADSALERCFGGTPARPALRDDYEVHAAADPHNPKNVAAAWMTVGPTRRDYVVRAAYSSDGGSTWSPPRTLPFIACAGGSKESLRVSTDPWVAFGPEGRLYVSAQAYQGEAGGHAGIQHISVITSADGGRSWDEARSPIVEQGPGVKLDNTSVTPDPARPGTAYVLTTHFTLPDPVGPTDATREEERRIGRAELSKTTDGGHTWSSPRLITPDEPHAYADLPQIVIDPRSGRLYMFYSNPRPVVGGIFLMTSEDGGSTWSSATFASPYVPLAKRTPHPSTGTPLSVGEDIMHAAIDTTNSRLFAVFVDSHFGEYAQIALVTSSDGGRTWTDARRVNTWQGPAWLPSIAVNSEGRVAVTYLDARPDNDRQKGRVNVWQKTFTSNANGDLLNVQEKLLDRFVLGQATPLEPGYFLGDYFSVVAQGDAFGAIYVKSVSAAGSVRTRVFFSR